MNEDLQAQGSVQTLLIAANDNTEINHLWVFFNKHNFK